MVSKDGLSVAPAVRAYGGSGAARGPAEMALLAAKLEGRVTVLDFDAGTTSLAIFLEIFEQNRLTRKVTEDEQTTKN